MEKESLMELEQELLRHGPKKKRKKMTTARKRSKGELDETIGTIRDTKQLKELRTRPRYRPRGG